MKPVVRIMFGSHLYGTNTPESDLDYKSVHVPDAKDILLQRVKESVNTQRAKGEGEKNFAGELDEESYSLQKYLNLLADGQTVAIDMLFAPEASILHTSYIWEIIKDNRRKLLSKKSAAFVGYCRTQANKYGIKGSRVAAARDAAKYFEAEAYWRPTEKVGFFAKELRLLEGEHTHIVETTDPRGVACVYFECCNRKVPFTASVKLAHEIYSKVYNGYGNRAHLAEKNEGIDWKAVSHAVRVGREALELLETGHVTFPLVDAAYILDIKKGRLSYDVVANEIEGLLEAVEKASAASILPENVDNKFIDELVADIYRVTVIEGFQ